MKKSISHDDPVARSGERVGYPAPGPLCLAIDEARAHTQHVDLVVTLTSRRCTGTSVSRMAAAELKAASKNGS